MPSHWNDIPHIGRIALAIGYRTMSSVVAKARVEALRLMRYPR